MPDDREEALFFALPLPATTTTVSSTTTTPHFVELQGAPDVLGPRLDIDQYLLEPLLLDPALLAHPAHLRELPRQLRELREIRVVLLRRNLRENRRGRLLLELQRVEFVLELFVFDA